MKILLLTQVLPYPPDSGPKVKTWNVIKYLTQNHDLTLVSFVRGDKSAEIDTLKKYCCDVFTVEMRRGLFQDAVAMMRSFVTGKPWMILRDGRSEMKQLLSRIASENQYDIVHIDQLNMAQYVGCFPDAGTVLDAHNALWLLYKRLSETMKPGIRKWLLSRDWQLLKAYEGDVCRSVDGTLSVSIQDKLTLEEAIGSPWDIIVVPITVDLSEFSPVNRKPDADHITHIGTMYWPPNIDAVQWFIKNIFPLVQKKIPGVIFDVVGSRPPPSLVEMGQGLTGIHVAGYVDDPTSYLEGAGVMVVPLRSGGGMRVKILNGLAQGIPIVTTTIGCEGIDVEDGVHLLVADTPEQFAEKTIQVLTNPELTTTLSLNGRELIKRKYDYLTACEPIDELYQQVVSQKTA